MTENFPMHYIGVRDLKETLKKEECLDFLIHNTLGQICNRNFVREKQKLTNIGIDKPYVADSLIHSTTRHYQVLQQISKSLVK